MIAPKSQFTYITENDIRTVLRDNDPQQNILLDDYEFKSEEIRNAATLAVDYWNEQPPDIHRYDVYTFPWRYHLIQATCANLLTSAAHMYRRNELNYNIPGGGITDQNKSAVYDAAARTMWAEYRDWVARKKLELNTSRGWGSY